MHNKKKVNGCLPVLLQTACISRATIYDIITAAELTAAELTAAKQEYQISRIRCYPTPYYCHFKFLSELKMANYIFDKNNFDCKNYLPR